MADAPGLGPGPFGGESSSLSARTNLWPGACPASASSPTLVVSLLTGALRHADMAGHFAKRGASWHVWIELPPPDRTGRAPPAPGPAARASREAEDGVHPGTRRAMLTKGRGSSTASLAAASKEIEVAKDRWRSVNGGHLLLAPVRALPAAPTRPANAARRVLTRPQVKAKRPRLAQHCSQSLRLPRTATDVATEPNTPHLQGHRKANASGS